MRVTVNQALKLENSRLKTKVEKSNFALSNDKGKLFHYEETKCDPTSYKE